MWVFQIISHGDGASSGWIQGKNESCHHSFLGIKIAHATRSYGVPRRKIGLRLGFER